MLRNFGKSVLRSSRSLRWGIRDNVPKLSRKFSSSLPNPVKPDVVWADRLRLFEERVYEQLHLNSKIKARALISTALVVPMTALGVGWSFFSDDIKQFVSGHTADVATSALADGDLHMQAETLVKSVLGEVTQDDGVVKVASDFFCDLFQRTEVINALVELLCILFNNPLVIVELKNFVSKSCDEASKDPEAVENISNLLKELITNEITKESLVELLNEVSNDPQVKRDISNLLMGAVQRTETMDVVKEAMVDCVNHILENPSAQDITKAFLSGVLTDKGLQKTSGEMIWNSLKYSILPKNFD